MECNERVFIEVTKRALKEVTDIKVNYSNTLLELSIDSLIFIKLIVDYENEFNVEFDGKDLNFENYITIGEIYEKIIEMRNK